MHYSIDTPGSCGSQRNNNQCLASKRGPLKGVGGGDPIPHPACAGSLGFVRIVWDVRLTCKRCTLLTFKTPVKKVPCLMHQYLLDASILARLLVHQQYLHRSIDAPTMLPPKHWCTNNTSAGTLVHQQYFRRCIDAPTMRPPLDQCTNKCKAKSISRSILAIFS